MLHIPILSLALALTGVRSSVERFCIATLFLIRSGLQHTGLFERTIIISLCIVIVSYCFHIRLFAGQLVRRTVKTES